MKKVVVAILLLTYTFAVSGATVELHYCMGKLIAADFDIASSSKCTNCGMVLKHKKGCCDNRQLQIKINNDQQATSFVSFEIQHLGIPLSYASYTSPFQGINDVYQPLMNGPPAENHLPVYISNCTFRI